MVVFGLTGGIGTGKSTVAKLYREAGVGVVDADQIARQVVEPGTVGLRSVVDLFGAQVLLPSGELDRKALGREVFSDEEKRKRLNGILHPLIADASRIEFANWINLGATLLCYEAALIVENGMADMYRPLVVVSVSPETQLKRIVERDRCSDEEASQRIRAQLPLVEKERVADFVIRNDGTLDELRARSLDVLDKIRVTNGP